MNWRTLAVAALAALGLLCTTGWTGAASEALPVYEGHEGDHPPQIDVTTTKSSHRWQYSGSTLNARHNAHWGWYSPSGWRRTNQHWSHNNNGSRAYTDTYGKYRNGSFCGAGSLASRLLISGGHTTRQLQLLRDLGSMVLCCTPSQALLVAEVAAEEGLDRTQLPLKVGIFGAKPWSERMREASESRLGLVGLNVYGLSEVIGPGVAIECTAQQGMHIFEDHFIPEVIDPNTTASLSDGNVGELVLTCVTKKALPLIRYWTRDRTRLMRGPCACGRTTARMDRVIGRTDDMLIRCMLTCGEHWRTKVIYETRHDVIRERWENGLLNAQPSAAAKCHELSGRARPESRS